MLNLHQLDIFSKVVEAGSFSKAAKDLLMSQSAVSQHIRSLEIIIGATLFVRGARGVSLTEAGMTLSTYADQIFGLLAEAQQAVLLADGQLNTRLRIGATPGVSVYLLPEWLSTFRKKQTGLAAEVQTDVCSVLVEALRVGRLDLAVVEGEIEEQTYNWLSVQKLCEVEQVVVVGHRHPWRNRKFVEMKELDGQRFTIRQPDSHTRLWLDELFGQYNVVPEIDSVLDNVESIKRAVSIGESLTILPLYAVRQEVTLGHLHTIKIAKHPLIRTMRLIWYRGAAPAPPLMEEFAQHLRSSKMSL